MTTLFIPALFSCHAQAGKRGLAPASRAPRPRLVPAAPAGTACLLRPSASATPRPRVPAGRADPRPDASPPPSGRCEKDQRAALVWFLLLFFEQRENLGLAAFPGRPRRPRTPTSLRGLGGPGPGDGLPGAAASPRPTRRQGAPWAGSGSSRVPGRPLPRPRRRRRAHERPPSREPGRPEVRGGPGLEAGSGRLRGAEGERRDPAGLPCGAGAPREIGRASCRERVSSPV